MSYSKLLMQMAQNYVIAANMAITANEPYNAVMFYENLNALLPDGGSNVIAEGLESDENSEDTEYAVSSYRVDIEKIKPEQIDRYGNQPYLTHSLASDRSQWEYLKVLSAAVLEALGKFASDHREQL